MLSLLLAAGLTLSPLPDELGATPLSWEIAANESFTRPVAADVVNTEQQSLKFIELRGICPEELRGSCEYRVRQEMRRKVVDGKLTEFVHRYTVEGPSGVRQEGVSHFSWVNDVPMLVIWYRKGDRWLTEEPQTEEFLTAAGFFEMLAGRHQGVFLIEPPKPKSPPGFGPR